MKLQTGPYIGVLRATVDLFDGVGLEWINRAETGEAPGVPCNLGAGPVIVVADGFAFIGDRRLVRGREGVRRREDDGARDVRFVHKADEFVGSDAIPAGDGDGASDRTVEVLVIVDDLGGGESGNREQDRSEYADRGHLFLRQIILCRRAESAGG